MNTDFASEGKRLLEEGRLVKFPGKPYGLDRKSRWWGWPPAESECVEIEPFDVPTEESLKVPGTVKTSFGEFNADREVTSSVPLPLVFNRAHQHAIDNLHLDFAVRFPLSHGGKSLGTFYAGRWGWRLG